MYSSLDSNCKWYYIVAPILDKVLGDIVYLSEEEADLLKDYIELYPTPELLSNNDKRNIYKDRD